MLGFKLNHVSKGAPEREQTGGGDTKLMRKNRKDLPSVGSFLCSSVRLYNTFWDFRAFSDKTMIALSINLVGELIMKLTNPDWLLVAPH